VIIINWTERRGIVNTGLSSEYFGLVKKFIYLIKLFYKLFKI